jgi:GNAT superfamily N-acetyltransferase
MPSPAPHLLDLRDHPRPELLAAFVDLYTRTFTDAAEREDPAEWPPRLYGDLPAPQPRMHLLVAVDEHAHTPRLLGGIAFEYYRASRCGLLTYLVTDTEHRRRGLARRLVREAIGRLQQDAHGSGVELRGVFAESEDPELVGSDGNAMVPRERLVALARLGARRVDIPYVQPALAGGAGRCRHLLLLAFQPQADDIDGAALRDFLHEFYRALGVDAPEQDADFRAMTQTLAETTALRAL